MHKDYWVAIGLYAAAFLLTLLPFLGIVSIDVGLSYATLKFLHITCVFVAVSVLIGQLIAFNVMQHARITTPEALMYLSRLDHVIPVCLLAIGVLGYSMAARHGAIWEVPWIHEAAFGLVTYTLAGLVMSLVFRRVRFQQEGGLQSPAAVYLASGIGVVFLLFISAVMVFKAAPVETAHHFTSVARFFAGS